MRNGSRFALHVPASMRERGRARFPVTLVDISAGGCRVEVPCALPIGDWVWLNISGLETQYARVVWCHDTFAGLEFAVPLSDLVVHTLVGPGVCNEVGRLALRTMASRCQELSKRAQPDAASELASLARECTIRAVGDALTARFG